MRDFVVIAQDIKRVALRTKVQFIEASDIQRDSITTVQVRIRLKTSAIYHRQ
jgi:hypothetical protein